MQTAFEQEWRAARTHEINGDLASAKKIYDALIGVDPDRLYVRLRLSALEQSFGNYRRARAHALKAAETVGKGRWKDLAVVTHLLLGYDERDLVYRLIEQAEWSSPEIIRNSAVLAQHLWLTGQVEASLRLSELAQARAPSSHLLSYSRANALRYCGRMQEATDEYERCLALKPDYATAHWSLAYHARSDTPGARVDRIKRAQASFADDAPEQAYLHYALFKEFDDAGENDAAWRSLQAGAGCKRRSTPYSPEREQQGFDALQRLATAEFIGDRSGIEGSPRTPIFIVGLPRSGTTLLERIVGNHAGARAGGELNDFNSAMCWEADRFLGMNASASMVDRLGAVDFSKVGRDYLRRTDARAAGSAFLIDKNPMNFVNAGFIGKALPHAKILCLRRAPMDACFSNLKELFPNEAYGYSYDLGELADHYRRFARLCEHWQNAMPGQFMAVDYEGLVSEPQVVAARVMDFCGIPFDPVSVDITRNTEPVATASSSQVRQPINRRGIDAWRKYATQLEPLRERLGESLSPLR
ncbi:MAG: tetratricopeptide repeat-containing sulfotransferase family protein [Lysobacter sp.]